MKNLLRMPKLALVFPTRQRVVPANDLKELLLSSFVNSEIISQQVEADLYAVKERDPACHDFISPFLYFKGFQALCAYRASNYLWSVDRKDIALYLQSLISIVYSVDIHPAAKIGKGILLYRNWLCCRRDHCN